MAGRPLRRARMAANNPADWSWGGWDTPVVAPKVDNASCFKCKAPISSRESVTRTVSGRAVCSRCVGTLPNGTVYSVQRRGDPPQHYQVARGNPDTRILYHREGCIGRGYWLTVIEVDDARKKAKILYNDRRDDNDPYDREDSKKVAPPGTWALFQLSRSTEAGKPDKIHLSIDGVKYSVKGPYFVSQHESVLPNVWR